MGRFAQTSVLSHSTGLDAGLLLFLLALAVYGGYILWAVTRRDEVDEEIRAALDYTARQAKTGEAINGGTR
jgi:hypothetical protein